VQEAVILLAAQPRTDRLRIQSRSPERAADPVVIALPACAAQDFERNGKGGSAAGRLEPDLPTQPAASRRVTRAVQLEPERFRCPPAS
jgi:hypothetical protein